ncbi:hypothetical protein [Bradyrhizobium sp.]|uniref:hypothetical protein n=1 Tax=Bradyrhizobium sp. TaxID=376 RepID=UPI0027351835|nr:hypothetical protein [Bradyrhizobium sp.]MDP3078559.1 hypothetical protein [Bradyrhizobium sp.]
MAKPGGKGLFAKPFGRFRHHIFGVFAADIRAPGADALFAGYFGLNDTLDAPS